MECPEFNHGKMSGFLGRDTFGRLFIDSCQSDEEHLTKEAVPGQERPGCRTYFDHVLVPENLIGQKSKVYFYIRFEPCTENQ